MDELRAIGVSGLPEVSEGMDGRRRDRRPR